MGELQGYLSPRRPGQRVQAVPGVGLEVPIWLLGSSLFSARLAAERGLPFAFAAHFAPADLLDAIAIYRAEFRPSSALERPRVMVGINVLAAGSDAEARRLFTSQQQSFANLIRGRPSQVPPPIDDIEAYWSASEKSAAERMLGFAVVGAPDTVERGLRERIALTQADEVILTGHMYDHADRLRSYEIIGDIRRRLATEAR